MDTTDAVVTEVIFPTKDLQDRLILHEKAVKQILLLEKYVQEVTAKALYYAIRGQTDKVLYLMLRKSVAEGVKRMFKQYRLQKWFQIQMIIHEMRMEYDLDSELLLTGMGNFPALTDQNREDTSANSWSVMNCEFGRFC